MFARPLFLRLTSRASTRTSVNASYRSTAPFHHLSSLRAANPAMAQATSEQTRTSASSPPAVTPESLRDILTTKIEAQHVEIEDLSVAYV
ncbi:uncharacterized protein GIQ15_00069 [Arthroderma uncinatum]|uniref:uncharacterized protein n=1 Tax=Arthroderma uncinatum TaxID=74035 RepID=UPI00144AA735|nr:uncharacterized protein GIQ15_00069 [Arthroderma uncinatum]KAF3490552.1 hypothetical protein GIQ15_00069 [Arthroderma uncinatum]